MLGGLCPVFVDTWAGLAEFWLRESRSRLSWDSAEEHWASISGALAPPPSGTRSLVSLLSASPFLSVSSLASFSVRGEHTSLDKRFKSPATGLPLCPFPGGTICIEFHQNGTISESQDSGGTFHSPCFYLVRKNENAERAEVEQGRVETTFNRPNPRQLP